MSIISSKERAELYKKVFELNKYISDNKISIGAIAYNLDISRSKVNDFCRISRLEDMPFNERKFNNLKETVSIIEKMKTISSETFEICSFVRNGDYHMIEIDDFYHLYQRLRSEFPGNSHESLIKQAKEKLSLKYDFLEEVFSRGFWYFANTFLPKEDVGKVLRGHSYLEKLREIKIKEDLCDQIALVLLDCGHQFETYNEEIDNLETVFVELTEKETEDYRLLLKQQKEKLEALRSGFQKNKAEPNEIEAAKKAERIYYSFCGEYDKKYFSEMKESQIKSLYPKRFQGNAQYPLTEDQQKAVLEVYLDKCFDENGFLIPDHFGSGIYMMHIGVGKAIQPFDRIVNIEEYVPGTEYKRDDPIPITDADDPLYRFINEHKNVLIGNCYTKQIEEVRQILDDVSEDVSKDLFNRLYSWVCKEIINSELSSEYNNTLSEYMLLILKKAPIAKSGDHSLARIYRIVYELCRGSGGKYSFSAECVFNTESKLMYDKKDWSWEMVIYSVCFRYKGAKRLIAYIQELISKDRSFEME